MIDAAPLTAALTKLAEILRQHPNASRFSDHWSWQAAPITAEDLATLADQMSESVAVLRWETADEKREALLQKMTAAVEIAQTVTAPNLFSGFQAVEAILGCLFAVEKTIQKISNGADLRAIATLAQGLKRKAEIADLRLNTALAAVEGIDEKLREIEKAYLAAEDLPFTQKQLDEAVAEVGRQQKSVQKYELSASVSAEAASIQKGELDALSAEARSYLDKIKATYRAVTSQGLAQAFSDREKALNNSMLTWVLGLLASLSIAAMIGSDRFPHVIAAVTGKPDWGVVIVNVILAAFSLAPAIWFAWVSTKQIGQRFRLAEDYAYKAAISAAYEGYRSEAAKLDPLLEAQLFASALGRLDELPLRLIEQNVAGSPLHDLMRSTEFKRAIDSVPGFLDRVLSVLKRKPQSNSAAATESDLPHSESNVQPIKI